MTTVTGSIKETDVERRDGALTGVRVVEFGEYIAGPLAGMLLADQGADVIHVDPPGGPRWDTPANAVWHRGKQRLTLDLHSPSDVVVARQLMELADVVVENFRPGVMDSLSLGADTMMTRNPGLIFCSIPGFASDDPRADLPGWEGIIAAATGSYIPITPMRAGPAAPSDPVFSAVPIASTYAAMLAVTGIAGALRARLVSGFGQRIEVPLFDAMFVALGTRASRLPQVPSDFNITRLFGMYRCADDRWIFLHTGNKRAEAYIEAIGAREWMDDADARERAELIFASRPALHWEELGAEIGCEVAMIRSSEEWLHESHPLESRLVEEVEDSRYGPMLQPGVAVTMSASPGRIRHPARTPDADRGAIIRDLDDATESKKLAAATRAAFDQLPVGALSGVKVVDLAIVLAGPTCGRTLAELGAEVFKVEVPAELDDRGVGMPSPASQAISGSRVDVNRGKYSIVLDLRSTIDQDLLWSLVDDADVLVQNFRRGVIDRLGFGYDAVRRRRPDLVYASLNTYGDHGPWRDRPGHEQLAQSVSGMAVRYGGDGPPKLQNVGALDDYGTGIMGAYGVILALLDRERTGLGQLVTTSLVATAGTLQSAFMYDFDGKQWDEPRGGALGYGALQHLYRTKDGTWIFLAARPDQAGRVAEVLGLDDFDPNDTSRLESRFAEASAAEWVERLRASGLGAHQVLAVDAILDDPWVRAHGLVTERFHEGIGNVVHAGPAIRMSRTPVRIGRPAPQPDADRDYVLGGLKSTA